MSKKYKDIYREVYDFDNLYRAFLRASKNKRYREEVLAFKWNLIENLEQIQKELITHTYKPGPFRKFYVYEPKKRMVMAQPFRDRVVQWAIYLVLMPRFERRMQNHSYACREDKGREAAADQLEKWVHLASRKLGEWSYAKLDIAKYFYRVVHHIAMSIFSHSIADQEMLDLLKVIVCDQQTAFGLPLGMSLGDVQPDQWLYDIGMPIGSLLSQMIANIYMNEVDHFAKHMLRLHYYIRYMDDIVILSDEPQEIRWAVDKIKEFVEERLNLQLNDKTCIRPVRMGIPFVGFVIYPTHRKVRRQSVRRMMRNIKLKRRQYAEGKIDMDKVNVTMQAYYGQMKHYNSYGLRYFVSERAVFRRNEQ